MAALLLAEIGPIPGRSASAMPPRSRSPRLPGEHYVTDLLAGAALVAVVRRGEPVAEPAVAAVNRVLQRLERIAAA